MSTTRGGKETRHEPIVPKTSAARAQRSRSRKWVLMVGTGRTINRLPCSQLPTNRRCLQKLFSIPEKSMQSADTKQLTSHYSCLTPIPLFVLSTCHPHPSTSYVIRAWWTSSTVKEADLESPPPPRKLAAAAGWRDASQLLDALVVYLLAGAVSPGRRPLLPRLLTAILHSPAMARLGRKGFKPAKQAKQIQLPPKY